LNFVLQIVLLEFKISAFAQFANHVGEWVSFLNKSWAQSDNALHSQWKILLKTLQIVWMRKENASLNEKSDKKVKKEEEDRCHYQNIVLKFLFIHYYY
jgi:high-affinity Fe2+/Pb2+ permease